MQAGIYYDLANEEYHGGPGDSKSDLDRVNRSLLHYKTNKDAANDNREQTAAQFIGSAFHTALLEPACFADRYVVTPTDAPKRPTSGQRNAKKPSAETIEAIYFWDSFDAKNAGKEQISQEDLDTLKAMVATVYKHPAAFALLTSVPGVAEASAYWNDPATGLLLRCRPDFWREDGIIVDVKTTEDASPEEFDRSIAKWRYHVQDAFYLDGTGHAVGQSGAKIERPREFVFLVVEKKPPYAVAVYRLDDEARELGRFEYRANLERLHRGHTSGEWPGYSSKIQPISVPVWYAKKFEGARA
jgi:exodeoxyribonuclease VIII